MATAMNVSVATSERLEKRASPQMPCPDVQPFPSVTPMPTSKPLAAVMSGPEGKVIAVASNQKCPARNAPKRRPAINSAFQAKFVIEACCEEACKNETGPGNPSCCSQQHDGGQADQCPANGPGEGREFGQCHENAPAVTLVARPPIEKPKWKQHGHMFGFFSGARAGDNAQALELARRLNGTVVSRQLAFNRLSNLPNWLLGAGMRSVQGQVARALAAPWPDIVVATGRRTAPVNLAIKKASGGQSLAIQIGRPRMALARFDLVLTTRAVRPAGGRERCPARFSVCRGQGTFLRWC
jgi:hypothetical protein